MTAAPQDSLFPPVPESADAVLHGLDPEQREVALALTGPVCVLAGAGTGKTRALTHRIAYGVRTGRYKPGTVLAVTFTQRAAGEMRGRLRELGAHGVQARTFHSAALRQLQFFWPKVVQAEPPRLVERKIQLVVQAAEACGLRLDRAELREVTGDIEWAKATQTVPDDFAEAAAAAGRTTSREALETARVYAQYEALKRASGRIDFEDVLLLTIAILQDREDIAQQVRSQYRHFTVDEYQDVSPLQQRLLDLWLGERDDVCVVGDASQTIYSFTGATPEHLLGFPARHPGATVVRLVRDYRSTPQIVHLANNLLSHATGPAARQRLELVAQRPPGPVPESTEYADEVAEAEDVAHRIRALVAEGVPAAHIAVLFRTNGQSNLYEQALGDAGVPYRLRGAEAFFDRPEIRSALSAVRAAAHSGANDTALDLDAPLPAQLRRVLVSHRLWTAQPPAGSGAVRERWESLAALVRLAEELARARPGAALTDLAAELADRQANQHAPTVDGVTLASLHAAKGLEWDAVFLVGLAEGMLPITYAQTGEQVEEERRLFYVGITRARSRLHLSWSLSRTPGGWGGRKPSRFLDALRTPGSARPASDAPRLRTGRAPATHGERHTPDRGAGERPVPRRRAPARCRVCGRTLTEAGEMKLMRCETCPSDMDEGVYQRLRDWRGERAQDLGQPDFCLFTDKTLVAIAEAVPETEAELSRIPGVGARKFRRFGSEVLAICAGQECAPGAKAD
ncbi:ATP-dependent DNA helicase UvrD2 [Streptomyces sp. CLI2509]|uniref:ATP-dependent DNA helicase UvrD2 n=2 Tax=unclassified Streptomyces TaxID=2593676 RepID=UPI000BAC8BB1|nr:ATP-dependent DNA helicase UvrD2 [Streptomyces sp. CLI2509]ASY32871.1 ATP-dependent DNA helicase [Streptomyces sp. CLI2509]